MSERTLKLSKDLRLPLGVVTEATGIVATRGAGKSSTAAVLVEETFAAQVPLVVIDWTGVFWGLRSNARGTGPGLGVYVLGGPHGDVPLEASAGRFIADLVVDSGHSFVLDLSDFTKGEMRRFCADFLERLYDRKARARTTLLLVIDEAHELAPQSPRGGFKGDAARLIGAMEQVVALGRSRGIGAVLITQRTQALNKAVLGRAVPTKRSGERRRMRRRRARPMALPVEKEQEALDAALHEAVAEPSVLESLAFMLGLECDDEFRVMVDRQLREADRVSPQFVRTMRNTRRAAAAAGIMVGVSLATSVGRLRERCEPVTLAEAEAAEALLPEAQEAGDADS